MNRNIDTIQGIIVVLSQRSQDAENISIDIENKSTKSNNLVKFSR